MFKPLFLLLIIFVNVSFAQQKPNIFWITIEDTSPQFIGCYMEIGEIIQQMWKDLPENKLNSLQKSLFEPRPAEFLFDIENDLCETQNPAKYTEYKPVLEKLRNLLKNEVLRSPDMMFLPEHEITLLSKTNFK